MTTNYETPCRCILIECLYHTGCLKVFNTFGTPCNVQCDLNSFFFIFIFSGASRSFNLLLVTLALFDSFYLFGAILESFRKSFDLASDVHVVLFPNFLYPAQSTVMTGSIFMTVAIAFERYSAVHFPMDYSQVTPLEIMTT